MPKLLTMFTFHSEVISDQKYENLWILKNAGTVSIYLQSRPRYCFESAFLKFLRNSKSYKTEDPCAGTEGGSDRIGVGSAWVIYIALYHIIFYRLTLYHLFTSPSLNLFLGLIGYDKSVARACWVWDFRLFLLCSLPVAPPLVLLSPTNRREAWV